MTAPPTKVEIAAAVEDLRDADYATLPVVEKLASVLPRQAFAEAREELRRRRQVGEPLRSDARYFVTLLKLARDRPPDEAGPTVSEGDFSEYTRETPPSSREIAAPPRTWHPRLIDDCMGSCGKGAAKVELAESDGRLLCFECWTAAEQKEAA